MRFSARKAHFRKCCRGGFKEWPFAGIKLQLDEIYFCKSNQHVSKLFCVFQAMFLKICVSRREKRIFANAVGEGSKSGLLLG